MLIGSGGNLTGQCADGREGFQVEYTVKKLAELAGVSARTLRFYDEIGLLRPARTTGAGYRVYGAREVDMLQQILFFRELDLPLQTIAEILGDPSFDRKQALRAHLRALETHQARLRALIGNVQKTIEMEEGEIIMTDNEKFEGFKQKLVDDNERTYGQEAREKYGDEAIDESNARMMNMTKAQYDAMQATGAELSALLERAVTKGLSPEGEEGREATRLHKAWLGYTWSHYSPEAHLGLTRMYVDDERFTAYYDKGVPGCAKFLRDAVCAWVSRV